MNSYVGCTEGEGKGVGVVGKPYTQCKLGMWCSSTAIILTTDKRSLANSGFSNAHDACCGAPPPHRNLVRCGFNYTFANGTVVPSSVCGDPERHVFFDLLHFTSLMNKVIFESVWSGKWPVTYPQNLQRMASLWK